ncbi:hypothetical protein GCM10009592_13120 [Brachybacterium rhamnosum]
MPGVLTLEIDGSRVHDIPSFYDEINRVFMTGMDWQLGPSLDALEDMLRGGFGALHGHDEARVVWHDHARSAAALGVQATRDQLLEKLAQPGRYDTALIARRLEQLDAEGGPTYMDTVLEIFGDRPALHLELA